MNGLKLLRTEKPRGLLERGIGTLGESLEDLVLVLGLVHGNSHLLQIIDGTVTHGNEHGCNTEQLSQNVPTDVRIEIRATTLAVYINGAEVQACRKSGRTRTSHSGVHVYASDPWEEAADATLSQVEDEAGALAPAIVYSGTRAADEIPIDNPELFAKDLQAVFDDPSAFSDIIVCAELVQFVLALSVIGAIAASRAPLPPGWFQCSLFGDDVDVDGGFPLEESRAIKQAGGVDAGATEASAAAARKKREAMKRQREKSDDWFGEATRAIFLTWVFVLLVTALAYALGLRGDDQGTASNSVIEKAFDAGPGGAASLVLTTVVLAPILEETVFRGFLLPSLTKYMTVPWAVALSTVVFAVAHEHNTGDTAQLLAVGAMAGISYARTRNLATSIVVHASFNLGVLVLYALWTHS